MADGETPNVPVGSDDIVGGVVQTGLVATPKVIAVAW
jgi:hypothetical protein